MTDDPFKDLRSKVSLMAQFPTLALSTKEARAQSVIDAFCEAWHPLFQYLQSVAVQDDFKPQGKILKAGVKYEEGSHSKKLYLIVGFCEDEEDIDFATDPHLSFYCGLITDAKDAMSQSLYTDWDKDIFANVDEADRQQAVYHMIRVMTVDNYADSTEGLKFTPYDFAPCQTFLNQWLATQIATDLGQGQPKAGTSRQFRFD